MIGNFTVRLQHRRGDKEISAAVLDNSKPPGGQVIAECPTLAAAYAIATVLNNAGKRKWVSAKEWPPESGWFQVVIEGHGTRYQKTDFWNGDDMQWKCAYEDEAVRVTHWANLMQMPKVEI